MKTRVLFSVTIQDFVPKAIAFGHLRGNTRDVLTFGLYNGQMSVLRRSHVC
jgi:hypothetical protein